MDNQTKIRKGRLLREIRETCDTLVKHGQATNNPDVVRQAKKFREDDFSLGWTVTDLAVLARLLRETWYRETELPEKTFDPKEFPPFVSISGPLLSEDLPPFEPGAYERDLRRFAFQKERERRERESKAGIEQQKEPVLKKKIPAGLRYKALKKDKACCVLCGRSRKVHGVTLHVDHIKPESKGGKAELTNLQTMCSACNLGKANGDSIDWR